MRKILGFAFLAALVLSMGITTAKAEEAAGPTITTAGAVDVYYLFNGASAGSKSSGGPPATTAPAPVAPGGRAFDGSDNTFRVALVKYGIAAKQGKAGAAVDFIYGQTADIISSGSGGTLTDSNGDTLRVPGSAILLETAMVSYSVSDKLTLGMGKCATPIGYEVVESWLNPNYSRSFIYWNTIPVVHSSIKANYTVNDKYSAQVMIANSGWADESSTSLHKNLLLQVIGNPSSKVGFILNGLAGNKTGALHTARNVGNLILISNPTEKISAALDLTYGEATAPNSMPLDPTTKDVKPYTGLALYINYMLNDAWKIGGRVERLNDKDGAAGIGNPVANVDPTADPGISAKSRAGVNSGTLTLSYKTGNFMPRLEYRYDEAIDRAGDKSSGFFPSTHTAPADPAFVANTSSQRTLTLSGVFTF